MSQTAHEGGKMLVCYFHYELEAVSMPPKYYHVLVGEEKSEKTRGHSIKIRDTQIGTLLYMLP